MANKLLKEIFTNEGRDVRNCKNAMAILVRKTIHSLGKITPDGRIDINRLSTMVDTYATNYMSQTGDTSNAGISNFGNGFIKALNKPIMSDKTLDRFIRMLIECEDLDITDVSISLEIKTRTGKSLKSTAILAKESS